MADALSVLRNAADIVLKSEAGLTELYEIKDEIARGAQSGSWRAVERRTGVTYALTEFSVTDLHAHKCAELTTAIMAQRNISDPPADVAEELRTARLACVHEVLQSPTRIILISTLAPTTGAVADDLLSMLERRGRLPEADARSIFTRLVLATKRAHDCGTVLRNIKPESVQIRQQSPGGEYEVCIADLHCAATVPVGEERGTVTGLHGTPEYCAPEVSIWYWHECEPPRLPEPPPPYGTKADVWALGICLHVMLCGCFPFKASSDEEELLRAINTADFQFSDPSWKTTSADALDLVTQLLQRDPSDRPFLEEVLQHPFCSDALGEVMQRETEAAPLGEVSEAALDMLDGDDDDEP